MSSIFLNYRVILHSFFMLIVCKTQCIIYTYSAAQLGQATWQVLLHLAWLVAAVLGSSGLEPSYSR